MQEAGDAAAGTSVLVPPVAEVFLSAIILLGIWLVIGKFALPRIYAMMDEREERIEAGLHAAEQAREDRALAEREREEALAQANVEAHSIREQANADAKRIKSQARESAQEEAARIQENAQRQIQAERQSAVVSLRSDIGELATQLAERIVSEQLRDQDLSHRVMDRFLNDLDDMSLSTPASTSAQPQGTNA